MRLPGLVELLGIAVTLAFALPVGMFGLNMALDGQPVGVGLLVLAILMVVLPHYLWSPPSPGDLLKGGLGSVTGGRKRDEG